MKGNTLILLLIAAMTMLAFAQSMHATDLEDGSGDSESSLLGPTPIESTSMSMMTTLSTVLPSSSFIRPGSFSPQTSSLILSTSSTPTITPSNTALVGASTLQTSTSSIRLPPPQFTTPSATQSSGINLTNMDDSLPLPLPALIAIPAGVVVIISAIFIVTALCCVRRRMRRKYTLKTAKNGGSKTRGHGQRSTSPVAQDLKDLTATENSKNPQGFGLDEESTIGTFGIEFPETPKYGSNEDIPALIILNPVKEIEPSSNALWSQTLPTRHKIRKQTCSESDKPDEPDPSVLKPAKSVSDIDTLTSTTTDTAGKTDDTTSKSLLLPDLKKKDAIAKEDEYDHLSPEEFSDLGPGYLFPEANTKSVAEKGKAEASSQADAEHKPDEDTIYLEPSSLPAPSQPPQQTVPTESAAMAAESESVYDTPKSSGIDASTFSPQESKQSTSSGPELSSISSREISIEVPSHYDVPKSALSSFKTEAPKQLGFSTQPKSSSCEASQTAGSPLEENHYDSLASQHASQRADSPPYYDIPKHLLMAKSGTTTSKKLDNTGNALEKTAGNKNNAEPLESSDEHVYCVPPDVAVNVLKTPPHKALKAEVSQTDKKEAENSSSSSKPVPARRKKTDNTARNSVVPAPRPAKRAINLPTKNSSGSISSSQEDLLQGSAETKKDTKTVPVPKPAVLKKPKVITKSSTASVSGSSEDILQEQSQRKVPVHKPVIAKKPRAQFTKNGTGSVTSSCEELLKDQEQKDDDVAQNNVTVKKEKSKSNSPPADGSAANAKPKPRVVPRSQSRQGIVQELQTKQTLQGTRSNADEPGKASANQVMPAVPKRSGVPVSSNSNAPVKVIMSPKRQAQQTISNTDMSKKDNVNKITNPTRRVVQMSSSGNTSENSSTNKKVMSPKRQAVQASSSADVPGKAGTNKAGMSPKRQAVQASTSADPPGKASSNRVASSAQNVPPKRPPIPQRPNQRPPPVKSS